jgi:hypothetical protein
MAIECIPIAIDTPVGGHKKTTGPGRGILVAIDVITAVAQIGTTVDATATTDSATIKDHKGNQRGAFGLAGCDGIEIRADIFSTDKNCDLG